MYVSVHVCVSATLVFHPLPQTMHVVVKSNKTTKIVKCYRQEKKYRIYRPYLQVEYM